MKSKYPKVKSDLKIKRLIFVLGIALMAGCFLYFRYIVPYHIGFKEQMLLFLNNPLYISSYFTKPAALACLGGDFLTQFFYLKTAGAIVVTLLFIVEWGLIFLILKRFSVKRYALLWSLLPVIIEWMLFQTTTFSVSFSVSLIITLSVFILYLFITEGFSKPLSRSNSEAFIAKPLSRSFYREATIILIPVLYVIAGASVFLFLVLSILYDIYSGRNRFFYWIALSALSLTLPVLLR